MTRFMPGFIAAVIFIAGALSAFAEEPMFPDYIRNSRGLVDKAEVKSLELKSFTDEVLIARNFIRSAEAEYKKHLGWSGKLDQKAEPTVRYFSTMAEIQASIVLARAGKIAQERERASIDKKLSDVKAKIKVFDDKNAEIEALKKGIIELNASLLSLKDEKDQLAAKSSSLGSDMSAKSTALATAEKRAAATATELEACARTLSASEKRVEQLVSEQKRAEGEIARLKGELSSLSAAKGVAESQSKEQIEALNREKDFIAEVGKLGGVIKAGSDNMTVIFVRSAILKSPKNDTLTADGDKVLQKITDLLGKYPEFRVKLKVHGFGHPPKSEDASATDRMARLIREALLVKGKFEPSAVEALGAGSAEPIYPKTNPEGNRRVEVTFVKK